MRTAGLALAGILAAAPAWAEFTTGDALVIGNARYGETVTAFGPDAVRAVARALPPATTVARRTDGSNRVARAKKVRSTSARGRR